MLRAIDCARQAASEGEVPIGAVLVREGELLGEGWNRTETLCDPGAHAEMLALKRAAARARNWRLTGAALIVTLEPCLMCFGALLEARVGTLVWGAADSARGASGLWKSGHLDRYPVKDLRVVEGVRELECRKLLQEWFVARRAEPGRASNDGRTWRGA
jgi:tRNA(adenine34) deaminase